MDYILQDAPEVPEPTVRRNHRERTRKFPFHAMRVRTMFFAPGAKPSTMMSLACATGKRLGFKFKTRKQYMRLVDAKWVACAEGDDGATLGVGVYRVE
jgi:hypothetical protein